MIGRLPTKLNVDGQDYDIRTDYRDCLVIMTAFNDSELSDWEKMLIVINIIYINPPENLQEAYNKAIWFLDCGKDLVSETSHKPQLYDWEQDEQMIFSAINKVAGKEIRCQEYMHWWTFLGAYMEIGESLYSTVIDIRQKKQKHKKLEKWEEEFYRENKSIVDLKERYTEAELQENERLKRLFD